MKWDIGEIGCGEGRREKEEIERIKCLKRTGDTEGGWSSRGLNMERSAHISRKRKPT